MINKKKRYIGIFLILLISIPLISSIIIHKGNSIYSDDVVKSCFVDIDVGDVITMQIKDDTEAGKDITIHEGNINLMRIGN